MGISINSKSNPKISKADQVKKPNKFAWSAGSILLGLFIGWMILVLTGNDPLAYFTALFTGNFGSTTAMGNLIGTLSWMIPLGLAMVLSFRAGVFNIGAAGQMLGAGMVAYLFIYHVNMGGGGPVLAIIFGMMAGAATAWAIGKLKTKFNVHEVISSIMLNWILFTILSWLTNPSYDWSWVSSTGVLNLNDIGKTTMSLDSWIPGSTMNWGIFIVVPLIAIIWVMYKFSSWGVTQDIIGSNPTAGDYVGINKDKQIVRTIMLSGSLAGLAGVIKVLGADGVMDNANSLSDLPAHGFQGISLSLIAFNSPLGLIFSSLFIGMMSNATEAINTAGINPHVTDLVIGIVVFLSAVTNYFVIYKPHDKWISWWNTPWPSKDELKSFDEQEQDAEKAQKTKNAKTKAKSTQAKQADKAKTRTRTKQKAGDK